MSWRKKLPRYELRLKSFQNSKPLLNQAGQAWLEGNLLENLFLVCLAVRSFGGIQELAQKRKNLDYIFDPAIFEKLLVFILLPAL